MRIALLGTRGVPACYSGFETCAEQLGQRLVQRGHQVTVYCRLHHIKYSGAYHRGMRLVKLPTIANKYLDTFVHTWLSSLHALTQDYDTAIYFIAANSPFTVIPRLAGMRTILNVNGLDWKRDKWPTLAKKYIQLAEYLATKLPAAIVTDSRVIQDYYLNRFGSPSSYIPYGSEVERLPPGKTLAQFGLKPDRYILFVGRLVPENRAHHLLEAFEGLNTSRKCVIVGDAPYTEQYIASLKAKAQSDSRVVLTGYVWGKGYRELGSNAHIFVETSGVGGTHPALVEAMAFGNCVVVNNTPENLETISDAGFAYDGQVGANSLREVLAELVSKPEVVADYRRLARARARNTYSWEDVTDAYERLIYQVCGKPLPETLRSPYYTEGSLGRSA